MVNSDITMVSMLMMVNGGRIDDVMTMGLNRFWYPHSLGRSFLMVDIRPLTSSHLRVTDVRTFSSCLPGFGAIHKELSSVTFPKWLRPQGCPVW